MLQGVSRTTAGNYSCVGFNAEGEGASPVFPLNVMCEYYWVGTVELMGVLFEVGGNPLLVGNMSGSIEITTTFYQIIFFYPIT